jgi:choline dehydrogenase-like flavoprotein
VSEESVDVLIVGAGAAGAALAWSLADTRMKILCLEQGDWMDPGQYPSTRKDWELRRFGDFGFSPNARGRAEDYPINDEDSPSWTAWRTTGPSTTSASSPTTPRTIS